MLIRHKVQLQDILQSWLDDSADEIGHAYGIWQDVSGDDRNALFMANACELVIDAMSLQNELERQHGD